MDFIIQLIIILICLFYVPEKEVLLSVCLVALGWLFWSLASICNLENRRLMLCW